MIRAAEIHSQHIIKDPVRKKLMRLFGMINTYPKDARFATQNKDEDVVIILRKHFLQNIRWMFKLALLCLVPIGISLFFTVVDTLLNKELSAIFTIIDFTQLWKFFLYFYYTFCISYGIFSYANWYYNLFIVTNERFIFLDFHIDSGMVITDIPLQHIVDISEKTDGFIETVFGYGRIEFKTTSEKFMSIEGVPQTTWFRDSFADLIKFIKDGDTDDKKDKIKPAKTQKPVSEVGDIIQKALSKGATIEDIDSMKEPEIKKDSKLLEP